MDRRGGRVRSGLAAVALVAVGLGLLTRLSGNYQDNAYLDVVLVGFGLIAASLPFLMATLTPAGRAQRVLLFVALALAGLGAILGCLLLTVGAVLVAFEDYSYNPQVQRDHYMALGLCLILAGGLWIAYRPGLEELPCAGLDPGSPSRRAD
jgi:hypothetical protein